MLENTLHVPRPKRTKRGCGYGYAARLAGCYLCVVLASEFVRLSHGDDNRPGTNLIWVANGVLLAFFLLAPRWRWPAYACVGLAGLATGGVLIEGRFPIASLFLNLLNLGEVLIAAHFLRRQSTKLPDFTHQGFLVRFGLYALLLGPACGGVAFACLSGLWGRLSAAHAFLGWAGIDSLGTAVATPACVAILRNRFRKKARKLHFWIYPLLLIAVTAVAFSQGYLSLLPIIFPLLVLILVSLGLGWASLATLFVAGVGGCYSVHGSNSSMLAGRSNSIGSTLSLQAFVASAMFMLYTVSVVLEKRRAAERDLEKIASLHKLVTENSRDAILIVDFEGFPSYASPALQKMTGWKLHEMLQLGGRGVIHPEDRPNVERLVERLRAGASEGITEYRVRKREGGYLWVEASLRVLVDQATGVASGTLNILRDVSERKEVELSRAFHNSLIRAIQEVSLDGILAVNDQGKLVSFNKRLADLWPIPVLQTAKQNIAAGIGVEDEQVLAQCTRLVKHPDAFLKRVRELYAHPEESDESNIELKDGRTLERYSSSLSSDAGNYLGRVWFFRDISDRRLAEQKLQDAYHAVEALAATDALTGLANRRRFDECLASEWRRGMRQGQPLSMLLIDVDLFKSYNDAYGHVRGDSCLRILAEAAMDVVVRPGDLVARFGGEEFAVILPNTSADGAREVAKLISETVHGRSLTHIGNPAGFITVSIGCGTMVPSFGQHLVSLVELADAALYQAKRSGRDRVCSRSTAGEGAGTIADAGVPEVGIGKTA